MRLALAVLAAVFFAGGGTASFAQGTGDSATQPPDPTRWVLAPESNRHEASGTNCLDEIMGFARLAFTGADAAELLGTCAYTDNSGAGNAGLRVRRYVSGAGESREAIDNDRALMEPDPVQGPPLFTVRMAPVTTGDGMMGGRLTITKVRNGYLIDCYAEGATLQAATAKIALICSN